MLLQRSFLLVRRPLLFSFSLFLFCFSFTIWAFDNNNPDMLDKQSNYCLS